MNQHRWTCLTTAVLTAVIAPLATVHAKNLSSPGVGSGSDYSPLSPQSLPTITPLVVTELETDAVILRSDQPVPQVSKLPTVKLLAQKPGRRIHQQHRSTVSNLPTRNRQERSPVAKPPSIASIFNPNSRVTTSIISVANPIEPIDVATIQASQPPAVTSFTQPDPSTPIVVQGDRSQLPQISPLPTTVINHSAFDRADVALIPEATDSAAGKINATTISAANERAGITSVPKVAPIVTPTKDRADIPSFEAGLPVFVFEHERTQQIVATAIAQVGETIVAPEPSIAIPVQRPKQSIVPTQLPASTVPAVPAVPAIVKIEQPGATIRPALEKIVATQTGKASWYGIEGGPMTANGERYNPSGLTAAHRTLPFGTKVRVTSIKTGKSTIVRINDRGPFRSRRIIDISAGAAQAIGIKSDGIGDVRMDILGSEG